MLYEQIVDLYKKFRLLHYRNLFGHIRERSGSLSATEAYAADVVYLLGEPTLGEFAECIGLSQPNATYKINNLMAKGYVRKTTSETDRRECRLHVTEKFFGYYNATNDFVAAAVVQMKEKFSQTELGEFEKMLTELNASLKFETE